MSHSQQTQNCTFFSAETVDAACFIFANKENLMFCHTITDKMVSLKPANAPLSTSLDDLSVFFKSCYSKLTVYLLRDPRILQETQVAAGFVDIRYL